MKFTSHTLSTVVTVLIPVAAIPCAVRDTIETGRVYLVSRQLLDDLPQRLTGPGRLRFVLQPRVTIFLGWRSGIGDARPPRPPYLYGLILGGGDREKLLRSGLAAVRDLIAAGIVLDALAQWLIFGAVQAGAAVAIGPLVVCIPYALARALSHRIARPWQRDAAD